jgi:ribosome-associated protein
VKPPPADQKTPLPSRTQRKKADRARKALAEILVALAPEQLTAVDLPPEVREAVRLAVRTRQHGARRRQLQYIGTLLRQIDTAPIRSALDNLRRGDLAKARAFQRVEAWRDALRAGQFDLVEEILARCPGADRQQLMQLARNARREMQEGRGASASRRLFRHLQGIAPRQ